MPLSLTKNIQVEIYIHQLGTSLNHAMALSIGNYVDKDVNSHQYIADIILVKGIPFYGFHAGYEYFLKIYIYPFFNNFFIYIVSIFTIIFLNYCNTLNPKFYSKVSNLLSSGAVMNQSIQTYESHLKYFMQFFVDHNLLGMGFMDIEYCKFRMPIHGMLYYIIHVLVSLNFITRKK